MNCDEFQTQILWTAVHPTSRKAAVCGPHGRRQRPRWATRRIKDTERTVRNAFRHRPMTARDFLRSHGHEALRPSQSGMRGAKHLTATRRSLSSAHGTLKAACMMPQAPPFSQPIGHGTLVRASPARAMTTASASRSSDAHLDATQIDLDLDTGQTQAASTQTHKRTRLFYSFKALQAQRRRVTLRARASVLFVHAHFVLMGLLPPPFVRKHVPCDCSSPRLAHRHDNTSCCWCKGKSDKPKQGSPTIS